MKKYHFRALFFCLLCLCSCEKKTAQIYEIGVDPSWYPLQLDGQEERVMAFSMELLSAIAKSENLPLAIVRRNWDNLLWGLMEKKYAAVLSSMRPYTFYRDRYSFSELFLKTGPIIVAPEKAKITSIQDLKMKEVAVIGGSSAALLLQKVPGLILRAYSSIPIALEALSREEVNAAAVEILIAQNFVRDIYPGVLKVSTPPLTNEGLRLLSLKDAHPKLTKKFDVGLLKLKKSGRYEELLEKWGLSPDGTPSSDIDKKAAAFIQGIF